jgi:hypothetical protein
MTKSVFLILPFCILILPDSGRRLNKKTAGMC